MLVSSAVLFVPSAAFLALSVPKLVQNDKSDDARAAATRAAVRATLDVLSYDYRTIDAALARMKADADPSYAVKLVQTTSALRSAVKDNLVVSTAHVAASGIEKIHGNTASVLVFVDQTTQSKGTPTPDTKHFRVQLTLTKSGSRWLLTEFMPS